jgi:hypothetical protein
MRNLVTLFYPDNSNSTATDQFTILMGEDGNSFAIERTVAGSRVDTLLVRQTQ